MVDIVVIKLTNKTFYVKKSFFVTDDLTFTTRFNYLKEMNINYLKCKYFV